MIKKLFRFFRLKNPLTVSKKKIRTFVICQEGQHYHLKEIYNRLNNHYFEGALDIPITWFGSRMSRPKTRVILGSYHPHKKMIKVNRILDHAHIPSYFVSYIVYHEMLHHVLPPIIQKNRRRQIHHQAFNDREKEFRDYALALEFSKSLKKGWFVS